MAHSISTLSEFFTPQCDTIIDVRSPSEFAEDHIPGAVNLPVLDDDERAEVGTIYIQDSPFKARKLGAALVAKNAALHLQGPLAEKDGSWTPLVYCWRGGQRSGSFATILSQVGWRARVIDGGYRAYRRMVVQSLYEDAFDPKVFLIDGNTGTAKTDILQAFAGLGGQIVDLEGLAHHRGSLFGGFVDGQPSQKSFESALAKCLAGLDPRRPVLIEAESSKIGDLLVPPSLWSAMKGAPRIGVSASLEARSKYLAQAYADLTKDADRLSQVIEKLRPYYAAGQIAQWLDLARGGGFEALAASLMEVHYDPRYRKAMADRVSTVDLSELNEAEIARAARHIAGFLN